MLATQFQRRYLINFMILSFTLTIKTEKENASLSLGY